MMLKINKKVRNGLAITTVLLLSGIIYLLYNAIVNPGFQEKKVPLYTYDNTGSINYTVYLKPNNLYNSNTLGEGELYITEFVEYIEANLKYDFTGSDKAHVSGSYDIKVKVQGFTEERDEEIEIWEKEFAIINTKRIFNREGKLSIDEKINIDLNEYNTFAAEIIEASKIRSQARLVLVMDVNIRGNTDKGEFDENISPSLIIPLDTNMFRISGNSNVIKSGAIEETTKVILPISKVKIIVYGTVIAILTALLIILLFFTEARVKDPHEKKLKKIFKKHGDSLVALNSDIIIENEKVVRTIEDLVRVADEIDKPILYKYSKNYKEINKFYIVNDNEVYVLDLTLNETPFKNEKETKKQVTV
jgi:hypothetical protein